MSLKGKVVNRALKHLFWIFSLVSCTAASAAEINDEKIDDDGIISIYGEITHGDLEKFRQISVKYRRAVVILDSDGGALLPAIEIGKIIKIAGFVTMVAEDAVCASSCALIWLAGERRLLSPEGHVGFHASYRDNNGRLEESGVANALIGNYLAKLNFSERVIVFATTAPPDEILWLTQANRSTVGIDFEDLNASEDERLPTPSPKAQPPSPPPIRTSRPTQGTTLPTSLPAALSQVRSRWIRYAGNAFYDASSIKLVKNWNGEMAGRSFWAVIDHSSDPEWKYAYSLVQYFVYCPDETVSVYSWTDYRKDGKSKVQEVSRRGVPAKPGSVQRLLVDEVCR